MGLAFLCPGQASQKVGMGHDIFKKTKMGKQYFEAANDIMGLDIQDIIFNGPEDTLKQTQYTQPAIYIVSVIIGEYHCVRRILFTWSTDPADLRKILQEKGYRGRL